ncbi:protein EPIDERMAL PATTERNING FACTOR 2 [Medicago truncatula]|uniref:Epidermal patterning factor-like protein n=1 Tax=Medicago truncatula TaxID=3880 RepID=A0A072V8D7_MEDTR|nr:protein EPIDERMAL PATTERNING FACTOR 2 [Medicago truncatula]KEH38299.1 epidermal patterning factor [Medicago truncatula]
MSTYSLRAHKSFLVVIFFTVFSIGWCLRVIPNHDKVMHLQEERTTIIDKKEGAREGSNVMELYPTGSTIPDCSHACGPCSPCKRVMVGYNKCSMAESCPMVYRCICKGKYYHVPSN